MKNSKILVIGGTHGDEELGIRLVELLKKSPIRGVEAIIANPRAVKLNERFSESDLNRCFGSQFPGTYESRRALKIKETTKGFDLVLDLHNTLTPNNNCSFVGVGCRQNLIDVAKILGLNRCVEATYDCINKYCLNTISIEISVGDRLDNVDYWYKQIKALVNNNDVPNSRVDVYRFNRRVSWNEKDKFNLNDWKPFKPLSLNDKKKLGLSGIIVPIFIGSKLTEFYATLLDKKREE